MELLNLIFKSFWHFAGFAILLTGLGNFLLRIWNRFFRHWNIRKHGYPPKWCDADGDFKKTEKQETLEL